MNPTGSARRALLALVPLVLATLAWLGWRLLANTQHAGLEAPEIAQAPARPAPESLPLEVPENETTGERIAGSALQPAQPAPPAQPRSSARAEPGPIRYRGLVLDYDLDQPVAGAKLVFEADKARELCRIESDAQGQFRTPQLAEEALWMRVEPPDGLLCDTPRVELNGRRNEIVVPLHRDPKTLAGAIRGELLREGGPWTRETLPKQGSVMLDLVPASGAKWSRRADLTSEFDAQGGAHLRFAFESLPKGEYELTLSSLSAWRWNPTSLRVTAPIDNVTFLRYDLDKSSQLVFKVSDRASGERIEKFDVRALALTPSQDNGVFLHTGPLETANVPDDARFSWSLSAEGYQPAFGDESAFVRHGGERIAEIALERGWATKLLVLVRDPAAKPGVHAQVELDGRSAGFTGEDGMLAVTAQKAPDRIVVRLPGWRMTNDPLQSYNGKSAAQRGQVTIVVLEKEK